MLQTSFIVALIVLFFHVCTWEGMIFSFISRSLHGLSDKLKKPLYDCPICATVWWGPAIVACGMCGHVWIVSNMWQLSIIIAAAAGINTVLIYVVNQGKALTKTLNEYDCNCTKKEKQNEHTQSARQGRLNKITNG
jgi:hypothetical protein